MTGYKEAQITGRYGYDSVDAELSLSSFRPPARSYAAGVPRTRSARGVPKTVDLGLDFTDLDAFDDGTSVSTNITSKRSSKEHAGGVETTVASLEAAML